MIAAPSGLTGSRSTGIAPIPDRTSATVRASWLLAGLAAVTVLRAAVTLGGPAQAFGAGTAFGLALIALAARAGWRARRPGVGSIALGIAGGVVLVVLPSVARVTPAAIVPVHAEPFAVWVAVTVLVAVGEEALLRGALFSAVRAAVGSPGAIAITSIAFALLHVPLYGWHVVPLDLVVGVWLAGLRLVSGGIAAPTVAHALADLATWWG